MAMDYINVLENYLTLFITSLGEESYLFQEDNAPIHTAKKMTKQKLDNSITCLPWPPQSPDLNPIKHLQDELECRVHGHDILSKNEDELFSFLVEEWAKIPLNLLENLVDSMPSHI